MKMIHQRTHENLLELLWQVVVVYSKPRKEHFILRPRVCTLHSSHNRSKDQCVSLNAGMFTVLAPASGPPDAAVIINTSTIQDSTSFRLLQLKTQDCDCDLGGLKNFR
jgi:hypothetical protein